MWIERSMVEVRDGEGRTALHWGAAEGGSDLDATDDEGLTPLHHAARDGSASMVRLLLSLGADASARDHAGDRPTDLATRCGHRDITDLLAGGRTATVSVGTRCGG